MPDGMARRDGNTTTVAGAPGRGRRFSNRGRGGGGRGGGGRARGGRGGGGGHGGGKVSEGGGVGGNGDKSGGSSVAEQVAGATGAGRGDVTAAVGATCPPPPPAALSSTATAEGGAETPSQALPQSLSPAPAPTQVPALASSSSLPPSSLPLSTSSSSPTKLATAKLVSTSRELLEMEAKIERNSSVVGVSVGVGAGVGGEASRGGSDGSGGDKCGHEGSTTGAAKLPMVATTSKVLWKVEWVFCSATGSLTSSSGSSTTVVATAAAAGAMGDKTNGDVTVPDPTVSEELSLFQVLYRTLLHCTLPYITVLEINWCVCLCLCVFYVFFFAFFMFSVLMRFRTACGYQTTKSQLEFPGQGETSQ